MRTEEMKTLNVEKTWESVDRDTYGRRKGERVLEA